jgi:hypothetical protein
MRGRKPAALAYCLALLLVIPASAAADDRYAQPGGNGPASSCPETDPCNIQAAVEDPSVADGDRIILLGSPHNLGTDQLVIDDDITIEPTADLPRAQLISSYAAAGGAVNVNPNATGALLRRLLITHLGSGNPTGLNLNGATAERVYVVSDGFIACAVTGGTLTDSVCLLTQFASNSAIGAVGSSVGGSANQQSTLRNVTAISKEPNAVGLVLSAVAGADLTVDARNVIAESSNFDVLASAGAGSTAVISLANSNFPTFDALGAGGSVTSNTTAGNQATPALFTNFAGNVFSQAPDSPTIDAGASDALLGTFDVDGNPRIVQGRVGCPNAIPDIGAYEAPAVTPLDCSVAPPPAGTPPAGTPAGTPAKGKKKCRKKKRHAGASAAKKKRCKKRKKR